MQRPFELVLIEHGAPTLAAVKPANLFRVEAASRAEVLRSTKNGRQNLHRMVFVFAS